MPSPACGASSCCCCPPTLCSCNSEEPLRAASCCRSQSPAEETKKETDSTTQFRMLRCTQVSVCHSVPVVLLHRYHKLWNRGGFSTGLWTHPITLGLTKKTVARRAGAPEFSQNTGQPEGLSEIVN